MGRHRSGIFLMIACSIFWGIMPIYWHALIPIKSEIIVLYRIFTLAVYASVFCFFKYGFKEIVKPFKNKKTFLILILAGIIVTTNWSIYIWAVNSGKVIEASIGYYIEPIVIVFFGIVFFKERVSIYKGIAFVLAIIAICIILYDFGRLPFVSLSVAITFAVYASLKKLIDVPPLVSLMYESLVFVVPIFVYIIYIEFNHLGAIGVGAGKYTLMLFSGLLTLIPLFLMAEAIRRISLVSVGLLGYLSPTISLFLGVFIFKEDFNLVLFTALCVIWVGLFFFTYGEIKYERQLRNCNEKR